jgi:hypothetical protein
LALLRRNEKTNEFAGIIATSGSASGFFFLKSEKIIKKKDVTESGEFLDVIGSDVFLDVTSDAL